MAEVQFRFRDDAPVTDPAVGFASFGEATNAAAVRIEPADDARALIPHLARLKLIEIAFPVFSDGRGFSSARILREAGFEGEIRAVGELTVDHLSHMRRCGFDAYAPDTTLDPADARAAFDRWPQVYQAAADHRSPIWRLRHPD